MQTVARCRGYVVLIACLAFTAAILACGCREVGEPAGQVEPPAEEPGPGPALPEVTPPPGPLPEPPPLVLRWYPREICPGDYFVLQLENVSDDDVIRCTLDPEPEFFIRDGDHVALVPLSYWTAGESLIFRVAVERGDETILDREVRVGVVGKEFATQHLYVTEEQSAMRSDDLWQQDWVHIERARAESHDEALWEGEFLMPVEGRISTEFGQIRYINDVPSGRHSGLDIAVPTGTPILAANSGTVTLSMALNVTGNTVIIDHGLNLFSTYYHLDKLGVQAGEWVDRGDQIGTVGSTGFSTGPHLHWTMGIGHTPIDPHLLVEEDPVGLFEFYADPEGAPGAPVRR